jgi:Winged helix DNA-binding domain
MKASIVERRLHNQFVARPRRSTPAELVAWLGAVQAQEYQPAKWGLSLRLQNGNSDAAIERAVNEGHILRTHVMRPTWHFVSRDDLHWMLQLTAPRVHKTMSSYTRHLGLETSTIVRAVAVFERALAGACHLTRAELRERLTDAGLQFSSLQMGLVTMYAELEGVICSGPRRGKQFTYALLGERAPSPRRLERDEALAELSRRFFSSHGPATIRDFVWWSGLTTADARRGLEIIKARSESVDGITYWTAGQVRVGAVQQPAYLLPIYDEYLVAYRDRVAVPHGPGSFRSGLESVTFQHAVISGGQIVGTWRTRTKGSGVAVGIFPLRALTAVERRALEDETARYGRFLGGSVTATIARRKTRGR